MSTISFALKFVVKFGGDTDISSGEIVSFGPPTGEAGRAHLTNNADANSSITNIYDNFLCLTLYIYLEGYFNKVTQIYVNFPRKSISL